MRRCVGVVVWLVRSQRREEEREVEGLGLDERWASQGTSGAGSGGEWQVRQVPGSRLPRGTHCWPCATVRPDVDGRKCVSDSASHYILPLWATSTNMAPLNSKVGRHDRSWRTLRTTAIQAERGGPLRTERKASGRFGLLVSRYIEIKGR